MEYWTPRDVKASWVAVFILLLFWWLMYLLQVLFPQKRSSSLSSTSTTSPEGKLGSPEGESNGLFFGDGAYDDPRSQSRRIHRLARHFRDGLLFLLTATALATIAQSPYGATNALLWVYTGLWLILAGLKYFTTWERITPLLEFFSLVLVVAAISNAFAHAHDIGHTSP